MKTYELIPTNGRKSFYGKAYVNYRDNGDIELISYGTLVCRIRNNEFQRIWEGYSLTTMTHINDFIKLFNINGGGKKW